MKVSHFRIVTMALCIGMFAPVAMAQDKHGHADTSHFKVAEPADVKAAWTLILAKLGEAEQLLVAKNMDAIHEGTENVKVAVHVLQEKSTMVSGDKQTRLKSVLSQLDKAADALHHAAEDKNVEQVALEIKKIKGLLPLVEGQFPAGVLK
jgi:hypothetical protein